MVSFQCESCGDVLTKKKLDGHLNRCWNTSFTCLDCHIQFWGQEYKGHTSCISEAQKYQGPLYKEKKPKSQHLQQQQPPTPPTQPRTPYQAYVKDAEEEPSPIRNSLIEINVPPPAPTPPLAPDGPVNVFDFLVDGSNRGSRSTSPSSYRSGDGDSDVTMSPEQGRSPVSSGPPSSRGQSPNGVDVPEGLYSYGDEPIEASDQRFDSQYDLNMQLTRVAVPPPAPTPPTAGIETPAPPHAIDERLNDSRSDKKRKRPPMEDLDTTRAAENRALLHSGLTGGLTRLLSGSKDRHHEASPLSPKKRSKRTTEDPSQSQKEERQRRRKDRKDREKRRSITGVEKEERRANRRRREEQQPQKLLEGRKDLKAIEYNNSVVKAQLPDQSNSEFFLGLIDKDHRSIKGQSIWGVMKMFHEGRAAAGSMDTDDDEAKRNEERKLFKGLRVKISKNGDIVLFPRPEAELEG